MRRHRPQTRSGRSRQARRRYGKHVERDRGGPGGFSDGASRDRVAFASAPHDRSLLRPLPPWPALRVGRQRVFRPGCLDSAPAVPYALPGRYSSRSWPGRRSPVAADSSAADAGAPALYRRPARRLTQPEQFLNPHRQHRRTSLLILNRQATAARDGNSLGASRSTACNCGGVSRPCICPSQSPRAPPRTTAGRCTPTATARCIFLIEGRQPQLGHPRPQTAEARRNCPAAESSDGSTCGSRADAASARRASPPRRPAARHEILQ
jgi:hypothetical protein